MTIKEFQELNAKKLQLWESATVVLSPYQIYGENLNDFVTPDDFEYVKFGICKQDYYLSTLNLQMLKYDNELSPIPGPRLIFKKKIKRTMYVYLIEVDRPMERIIQPSNIIFYDGTWFKIV